MNPEKQRIKLAEWDGWKEAFPAKGQAHPETKRGGILLPYHWVNERTHERVADLPDYLSDLNAVHELEKRLSRRDYWYYADIHLLDVVGRDNNARPFGGEQASARCATAAQRCEALLKTLGLWEESE
jgi:hypothetical protein